MIILGIETSCDETAAAILDRDPSLRSGRIRVLSNIVASSSELQAKYGGIIPEQAAREQIKSIIPVIEEALVQAFPNYTLYPKPYTLIDAIAVTYGPGLIGSLLVGVETAKTLAMVWNKPLIPVSHLIGHFYANWITIGTSDIGYRISENKHDKRLTINDKPEFPCLGLLVSGGHTDLVLFTSHGKYRYLGGTRDDAAGECFDKCARLLRLPYPGGPEISRLASQGDALRFNLPRPMIDSDDFDFSFSGLKTAVARIVGSSEFVVRSRIDLAASIEAAIVDVLVAKTIRAARKYKVNQIMVAGGVASNQKLKKSLVTRVKSLGIKLHVPPPQLCTDNGAMIAAAGFFTKSTKNPLNLQADPNLALAY